MGFVTMLMEMFNQTGLRVMSVRSPLIFGTRRAAS
jgi:hypothetical protein